MTPSEPAAENTFLNSQPYLEGSGISFKYLGKHLKSHHSTRNSEAVNAGPKAAGGVGEGKDDGKPGTPGKKNIGERKRHSNPPSPSPSGRRRHSSLQMQPSDSKGPSELAEEQDEREDVQPPSQSPRKPGKKGKRAASTSTEYRPRKRRNTGKSGKKDRKSNQQQHVVSLRVQSKDAKAKLAGIFGHSLVGVQDSVTRFEKNLGINGDSEPRSFTLPTRKAHEKPSSQAETKEQAKSGVERLAEGRTTIHGASSDSCKGIKERETAEKDAPTGSRENAIVLDDTDGEKNAMVPNSGTFQEPQLAALEGGFEPSVKNIWTRLHLPLDLADNPEQCAFCKDPRLPMGGLKGHEVTLWEGAPGVFTAIADGQDVTKLCLSCIQRRLNKATCDHAIVYLDGHQRQLEDMGQFFERLGEDCRGEVNVCSVCISPAVVLCGQKMTQRFPKPFDECGCGLMLCKTCYHRYQEKKSFDPSILLVSGTSKDRTDLRADANFLFRHGEIWRAFGGIC